MDEIPIGMGRIGSGANGFPSLKPYRASCASGTGRFLLGVALTLFIASFAAAEDSEGSQLQRARELSWSGDYGESLHLYGKLLEERPEDPTLRREHGLVLRVGLIGTAKIKTAPRTIAQRLWRYVTRTFNFDL